METVDDKELLIRRMVKKNHDLIKTIHRIRSINWILKTSLLASGLVIAFLAIW